MLSGSWARWPPNIVLVLSMDYRFCDPNFSVFVVDVVAEREGGG